MNYFLSFRSSPCRTTKRSSLCKLAKAPRRAARRTSRGARAATGSRDAGANAEDEDEVGFRRRRPNKKKPRRAPAAAAAAAGDGAASTGKRKRAPAAPAAAPKPRITKRKEAKERYLDNLAEEGSDEEDEDDDDGGYGKRERGEVRHRAALCITSLAQSMSLLPALRRSQPRRDLPTSASSRRTRFAARRRRASCRRKRRPRRSSSATRWEGLPSLRVSVASHSLPFFLIATP